MPRNSQLSCTVLLSQWQIWRTTVGQARKFWRQNFALSSCPSKSLLAMGFCNLFKRSRPQRHLAFPGSAPKYNALHRLFFCWKGRGKEKQHCMLFQRRPHPDKSQEWTKVTTETPPHSADMPPPSWLMCCTHWYARCPTAGYSMQPPPHKCTTPKHATPRSDRSPTSVHRREANVFSLLAAL